jgi:hypothetical protein
MAHPNRGGGNAECDQGEEKGFDGLTLCSLLDEDCVLPGINEMFCGCDR